MNIKVNLQDGTPAQFKTEIIDGTIVVTVVEEAKEEKNLFPKWEELGSLKGYWIGSDSYLNNITHSADSTPVNSNIFTTSDLAKASLATARVSQTYRRYRELVGEVDPESGYDYPCGLMTIIFANFEDYESFYHANKSDLDLIYKIQDTVQL